MNSTDPVSPVSPDSFDVSDSSAHLSSTSPAVSPKRAVLLLSGGLDSATVLAIARSQGFTVHCLAVRYQQRHSVELEAAQRVAVAGHAAELRVIDLDLSVFGGSALTDQNISVPKDRDDKTMESEIPITYVPARNTVFLSLALAYAEVIGAQAIFVGVNQVDYSGYPDCRPAFIEAFEKMANLATRVGVESPDGKAIQIVAPLMNMSKSDIVTVGTKLGVDYSLTHSCYDPVAGLACGRCDSCTLRRNGFRDAGLPDPTRYAPVSLS